MIQKLSAHFNLSDFLLPLTRFNRTIHIQPCQRAIQNMKALAVKVLEPLAVETGMEIQISKGFVNEVLNKRLGGEEKNHHQCFEGYAAADIYVEGIRPQMLADVIIGLRLDYHQIIDCGDVLHVSHFRMKQERLKLYKGKLCLD